MVYLAIRIAFSLCHELLVAWVFTQILTMRSRPAFYALYLSLFLVNTAARELGAPDILRTILSVTLCDVGTPLALSTGRLSTRIRRVLLVNVDIILAELLGSTLYALISGGTLNPAEIGPNTIMPVVTIYTISLTIATPVYLLTVASCNRRDGAEDSRLQIPVIGFMVGTILLFSMTYLRFCKNNNSFAPALATLLFCWLSLFVSFAILVTAKRETETRREISDRMFTLRQAKHSRTEIELVAKRATDLYKLRHALANQMRTISRFAESGQLGEADLCLSNLESQAHALAGDRHE